MDKETKDLLYKVYMDSLTISKAKWEYLVLSPNERMKLSQEYYREFLQQQETFNDY